MEKVKGVKMRTIAWTRRRVETAAAYGVVTGAVILFLFPIGWTILTSIKSETQAFQIPPVWVFWPTLENYATVFRLQPFFTYFGNTLVVTVVTTTLSLTAGTLAGYSLARFPFPGKRGMATLVFTTRMMPPMVLLVPLAVFWRILGLTDSLSALVMTYNIFNVPFVTWLMWGFFQGVPVELEEAAMVDGTTRLGALWRVVLPLAKPGLLVAVIFCVLYSWNEFAVGLILTTFKAKTAAVGAAEFVQADATLWGPINAVATLLMIPVFVFAPAIRNHFVKGITVGALQ